MRILVMTLCLCFSQMLFAESAVKNDDSIPLQELRLFSEVFHQIRNNYVSDVSDKQLLQYAIEGMLSNLDPHSAWLDKDDFLAIQEMTQGEFAGIGVEVVMEEGVLKIVAPIDDTPAKKAGILAGDKILQINDKTLKGLSLDESINLMRGKEGSAVTLTIWRDSEQKTLSFKLKRAMIKIVSVKGHLINHLYAYLRISQFQQNTAEDAQKELLAMQQQAGGRLSGIILDLRNNPGGVLDGAVALSNLFIKQGLIVYTQGRKAENVEQFFADGKGLFTTVPMVVLIDGGSASASEIVSGALQDHKRAIILGSASFGKGSVQTILPLPDDNAIKLTTALYYTPLGRSIQAEGIKPDILSENITLNPKEASLVISEASLANHIDNKKQNKKASTDIVDDSIDVLKKDYNLYEAVNLLKAMAFMNSQK